MPVTVAATNNKEDDVAGSVVQQQVRAITDEEVSAFVRDGWVFLPGLVDRELVADILAASKSLMGESGVEGSPRPGVDMLNYWHDRHFMAREGIEPFRSLSYSPQMGRAVQRFNERDVAVRHWADMIAVKPPAGTTSRSGVTPLHQDYASRHFDRVGNVTFWIALEAMPAERGTCRFRTGSHRLGPLGRNFRGSSAETGLDIHDAYPWLAERCPLSEPRDMQPGDATAHGPLVLHTAPANLTGVPRWAYISIYIPADTLWTGTSFLGQGDIKLEVDQPFDHPNFPIVYA
ncbi:MAG TPA: phytanoyl-CoA dioxygenase family protein [Bryobacteraceae bacterium]|jgi:hypothetical protein|nr:phytanoyl-CoA dioxygenase family protein [Bryobacteraceae bacterium]